MLDLDIITSIIIIILSIFQTVAGIGILVLGTPILLLMGFGMIDVMIILLPLSVLNSFLNILFLKYKQNEVTIDNQIKKYFFLICFPGVFLGLIFLKYLAEFINFNVLVSLVIWIVLFSSFLHKKNNLSFLANLKKSIIFLTGFIHGLTNSGGSLLSILIIETYKKNVNFLRYQIIFFYFFLALFQYLSIILINNLNFFSGMQVDYFFSLVIGVVIGNILSRKVNNVQFKMIIFLLAFLSSIFLLIEA